MIEHLLNAGVKLAGGLMDRSAAKDANATRIALANQEYERQKEFAQMGISWKVKDALSAGVHPLFALGASTSSYAPQSIGVEKTGIGSALADMGQDVSRAVASGSTQETRNKLAARDALVLEGVKLDNDIKRATLQEKLKSLQAPAAGAPVPEADKPEERPQLYVGGKRFDTYAGATNAEDFEKRYGDLIQEIAGIGNFLQDSVHSLSKSQMVRAVVDWLRRNNINTGYR